MMRFALVLCVFFSCVWGASTVDKIHEKTKILENKVQAERQIHGKMQDVASEIIAEEAAIEKIKEKIGNLEENILQSQNEIAKKGGNLERLTKDTQTLLTQKKELEEKITKIIAEDFSFYLMTEREYIDSKDSVLVDEIIHQMDTVLSKEFTKLTKEYKNTHEQIQSQSKEMKNIHADLKNAKTKYEELLGLEKKKESSILALNQKKETYKKQLDNIEKERDEIHATLQQLQIIKGQEEAKLLAEKNAKKGDKKPTPATASGSDIRQLGSSYQESSVKKYTGEKTISPLDDYTIKRRFGDYMDPIYKMKIFNENVVLSSKTPDVTVKNVLNGKVIFAKDTASLKKVVIVENGDGIHTIYAHLSKIAPTIEVGQKIKKGYVLGRVDNDLTFEVTQKNYHIDPLELIGGK